MCMAISPASDLDGVIGGAVDLDKGADFAVVVDVFFDAAVGGVEAGQAGDADVFLDGAADEFLDDLFDGAAGAVGVFEGVEVGGGVDGVFEGQVHQVAEEFEEAVVAGDEVGLAAQADQDAESAVVGDAAGDEAFLHFVGEFFVGGGAAAFAEEFDAVHIWLRYARAESLRHPRGPAWRPSWGRWCVDAVR